MGLRDWDAGRRLSADAFGKALAGIRITDERLRIVEVFVANPEGLTSAQLGALLGNQTTISHATGNRAAGHFGKAIAANVPLPVRTGGWWVGAAFETWRDATGRPLRLALWPKLERALEEADGWCAAVRRGKGKVHPATMELARELDDPGRFVERLTRDRQSAFRRSVLGAWRGRCAITGCAIEQIIEAAHIERFSNNRAHVPGNGIPLRADLHRLFDAGLLRLRPDHNKIVVELHPSISHPDYRRHHGRPARKALDPQWTPNAEFLWRSYRLIGRARDGW